MMAEKEDKFLKMRKEIMAFAERERKSNMSTMDFVDCIIVNWFIPYKEQARKEEREKIELLESDLKRALLNKNWFDVRLALSRISDLELLERKKK